MGGRELQNHRICTSSHVELKMKTTAIHFASFFIGYSKDVFRQLRNLNTDLDRMTDNFVMKREFEDGFF